MLSVEGETRGVTFAGEWSLLALNSLSDAIITTDVSASVTYLNPAAESLVGWRAADALSLPSSRVVSLSSHERTADPVCDCLEFRHIIRLAEDTILLHRDGYELAIEGSAVPMFDNKQLLAGAVLVFRDVSAQRLDTERLTYQAHHDFVTGLENRRAFELELTRFLQRPLPRHPAAFLYLDFDQFKVVNDTGGHAAGDTLLRRIGGLMQAHVASSDCVARLGGDEFGILLQNCTPQRALSMANELRESIASYRLEWEGRIFAISSSVGVVPIPDTGASMSSLFIAADDCAYLAKDAGGNQVRVFEVDDTTLVQRHGQMEWVGRIQDALRNNYFCLYYQPIVSLGSHHCAYQWGEILVRICADQNCIIPPSEFVPAAERFGLISSIDRWVVTHSLEALSIANRRSPAAYSINLSGTSLSDETFLAFVVGELARTRIDPAQVCFEITETAAVTNLSHAMRFIDGLKALGCKFALDDFGIGLSSFAYLRNLPVDYLKIPGRFVKSMVTDAMDHAMVEGIQRMTGVLGIKAIAEHIEDEVTLQAVQSLGVEFAQGNYLGTARAI